MKKAAKKFKVLLVSEYFPPKIFGGGEISAYLLAKNLVKRGVDTTVLTSRHKGLPEEEEKEKIKILRRLKTGDNPNSIIQNIKRAYFRKSVRKEINNIENEKTFDIIHFLNTTSIIKERTWAKKIATINGYAPFCPKGNLYYKEESVCTGCRFFKMRWCILNSTFVGKTKIPFFLKYNPVFWCFLWLSYLSKNEALKHVDKFIAISDFIKSALISNKISASKIEKAYNIADIENNNLVIPALKSRIKGKKVVAVIGVLEKIKGVDKAIAAFLKIKHKNAVLLIVGDGSEKSKLQKMAKNKVIFTGKVNQKHIPFIYKNSNLILLTSKWPEPFSRIPMEAAYFKVPVLASAIGGNLDLPDKYLYKSQAELTKKIDLALSKNPQPQSFEIYKPEKNINKIISFYKQLCTHSR